MQIFVLGTSGDGMLTARQSLASGGIVIGSNDLQIHYDPGPGALAGLFRAGLNPRNTGLILVSHNHLNHAGGAVEAIAGITYDKIDIKGVMAAPRALFDNSGPGISIPLHYQQSLERVIPLGPGDRISIGNTEILAYPAEHGKAETLGYIIRSEGLKIALPSDTVFSEEVFKPYINSDLLILNVVNGFKFNDHKHMSADDAVLAINYCKPKSVLLTHFGTKVFNHGPMYVTREIKKIAEHDCNVITARDNLVLRYVAGTFNANMLP